MEPVIEEQPLNDVTWSLSVMEQNAREAAALLKALAHESRLMILCNLIDAEKTVTQLNQTVPLSQSALSQHLAKLRHQGLVTVRKEAQMVYYRLKSDKVSRLLSTLYDIYCR
jgi:DNA-binding transcriptional ArsR family regulator